MNTATIRKPMLRFPRPLRLKPDTPPTPIDITRPFFQTAPRPAAHDMLLLNAHLEFLATPEPTPPRDLTFFNLDRP